MAISAELFSIVSVHLGNGKCQLYGVAGVSAIQGFSMYYSLWQTIETFRSVWVSTVEGCLRGSTCTVVVHLKISESYVVYLLPIAALA